MQVILMPPTQTLGMTVTSSKIGLKMAVKFQIMSRNFKAFKKVDIIKVYSFCLMGVYLIKNFAFEV